MIWTNKHYAKRVPLLARVNALKMMEFFLTESIVRAGFVLSCRMGGNICREFTFA
jgi:hypothetical protein